MYRNVRRSIFCLVAILIYTMGAHASGRTSQFEKIERLHRQGPLDWRSLEALRVNVPFNCYAKDSPDVPQALALNYERTGSRAVVGLFRTDSPGLLALSLPHLTFELSEMMIPGFRGSLLLGSDPEFSDLEMSLTVHQARRVHLLALFKTRRVDENQSCSVERKVIYFCIENIPQT